MATDTLSEHNADAAKGGLWSRLKLLAERIGIVQVLGGALLVTPLVAAYNFVAKSSELEALRKEFAEHRAETEQQRQALLCELRIEVSVNQARGEAIEKVRGALRGLSKVERNDELLSEIRESVTAIDGALSEVRKVSRLRESRAVGGSAPCPV